MPLVKSSSNEARSENIAAERRAGKLVAQAAAIAYSVQRRAEDGSRHVHVYLDNSGRDAIEHDPKSGQFTSLSKGAHSTGEVHTFGSKFAKKTAPAQHFEVHHRGKHLGHVRTYVSASTPKSGGGGSKPSPEKIMWEANPLQKEGQPYRRISMHHPRRQDAVEHLVRNYGRVQDATAHSPTTGRFAPGAAAQPSTRAEHRKQSRWHGKQATHHEAQANEHRSKGRVAEEKKSRTEARGHRQAERQHEGKGREERVPTGGSGQQRSIAVNRLNPVTKALLAGSRGINRATALRERAAQETS